METELDLKKDIIKRLSLNVDEYELSYNTVEKNENILLLYLESFIGEEKVKCFENIIQHFCLSNLNEENYEKFYASFYNKYINKESLYTNERLAQLFVKSIHNINYFNDKDVIDLIFGENLSNKISNLDLLNENKWFKEYLNDLLKNLNKGALDGLNTQDFNNFLVQLCPKKIEDMKTLDLIIDENIKNKLIIKSIANSPPEIFKNYDFNKKFNLLDEEKNKQFFNDLSKENIDAESFSKFFKENKDINDYAEKFKYKKDKKLIAKHILLFILSMTICASISWGSGALSSFSANFVSTNNSFIVNMLGFAGSIATGVISFISGVLTIASPAIFKGEFNNENQGNYFKKKFFSNIKKSNKLRKESVIKKDLENKQQQQLLLDKENQQKQKNLLLVEKVKNENVFKKDTLIQSVNNTDKNILEDFNDKIKDLNDSKIEFEKIQKLLNENQYLFKKESFNNFKDVLKNIIEIEFDHQNKDVFDKEITSILSLNNKKFKEDVIQTIETETDKLKIIKNAAMK